MPVTSQPYSYALPCTNCPATSFITFTGAVNIPAGFGPVEDLVFASLQNNNAFYLGNIQITAFGTD